MRRWRWFGAWVGGFVGGAHAAPEAPAAEAAPVALAAAAPPFTVGEGTEVASALPLRDLATHVFGYTRDGGRLLALHTEGAALLDDRGTVRAGYTCAPADGAAPTDLAVSSDMSVAAARYGNGRVCAWSADGAPLGAPGKDASAVAVGPAGMVVLGYGDGRLEGFDPRGAKRKWMRNPDIGPIVHMRFERAGPRVAASTGVLGVSVIDTRSGRLVRALRGTPAYSAAFDPRGATLAVGRGNGRVEVWDTKGWYAVTTFKVKAGNVVDLDFAPDGKSIAVATERGAGADRVVTLEVYDFALEEVVFREIAPAGPGPTRARYDALGDRLVVGNGPGASRMWMSPGERTMPRPLPSDEPPHQRPLFDPIVLPPLRDAVAAHTVPGALATDDAATRVLGRDAAGLAVTVLADGRVVPLAGSANAAAPIVLAPDGGRAAAWADDRLLVWDTGTGALLGRVAVGRPRALALLGGRLAVATEDGKVYAGTLERVRLVPNAAGVTAVAIDPFHADRVGVGTADGGVRVVEARTGEALGAWGVHAGALTALRFSADGGLLATAGPRPGAPGGRLIVLGTDPKADEGEPWSAVLDVVPTRLAFDGAARRVLAVGPGSVSVTERAGAVLDLSANVADAGFSGDGATWVDTAGAVRAASFGPVLPTVPRGALFARSDDFRFAVTVDGDRATVWDDRSGLLLRELPATGQEVRKVVFGASGDRLAVLYADASIEVYDVATGDAVRNVPGPPAGADTWFRFSEDETLLWVFSGPRVVTAWKLATGLAAETVSLPGDGPARLDPATARVRFVRFTGGGGGDVWLDTHATSPRRVTTPADGFRPLAVPAEGTWIVAAQGDALVRVDVETGRRLAGPYTVDGDGVATAAAVSPDGAWIAASYQSGLVRIWEVERGLLTASIAADARLATRGAAQPVASVAFDDVGELITVRDPTGFPRLFEWRISVEAPAMGLGAGPVLPSADVPALAVSPNGAVLYSAHGDGNARSWDLATGAQTNFFWGHAARVTALAVAQGGAWLVTGSEDGSVRAWDSAVAVERVGLNTFGDPVRDLAVSPTGFAAAAVGDGKVLRTWGKAVRRWSFTGPAPTALVVAPGGEVVTATLPDGARWALEPATGAVRPAPSAPTPPAVAPAPPAPVAPPADPGIAPGGSPAALAGVAEVRALAAALSPITAEVRTPDGTLLVTAGADGRIRLWDIGTRSLRATLRAMTDGSWVVDRADGTRYASESLRDGTSKLLYRPPPG